MIVDGDDKMFFRFRDMVSARLFVMQIRAHLSFFHSVDDTVMA